MKVLDMIFDWKMRRISLDLPPAPRVETPDETINQGFTALYERLRKNLAPPVGKHSDIWARPAPKFPSAYLWDSAFIAQAWKHWDPRIGFRILKPFVEFQDDEGRMPHVVFWGGFQVSPLSNPPFLAWSLDSLCQYLEGEKSRWLDYFVPPLLRFIDWRKKARFNEEYGLYFWKDSYESGIDNSPRFRSVDEREDYGVEHLGSIDLNCEIVLQHRSVINLLRLAGKDDQAVKVEGWMEALKVTINDKLWDDKMGIYGDLDLESGELRTIDTIASYFPLVMPDLPGERVKILVDNLKDRKKYNTLIPLPTVAHDSPMFMKDMWRGPVWVNTSYLIIKSLREHGFHDLAAEYAYRTCKGVHETWRNLGYFYEFYDPDRYDLLELDRKKGNLFKKITLGAKPVKNFAGWTADANAMLLEEVIGVTREGGKWVLFPGLPAGWMEKGNTIKAVLPFHGLELFYNVVDDGGTMEFQAGVGGKIHSGTISNGEKVPFGDP